MRWFDTVIVVDWSARSTPSRVAPSADAIWIGIAENGEQTTNYVRTRHEAMRLLGVEIARRLDVGRRILAGFDFPFGYPAGSAGRIADGVRAFDLWVKLHACIEDRPNNANNRFIVANEFNREQPGVGPFWTRPAAQCLPHLPFTDEREGHGFSEERECEVLAPGASTVWQLLGNGTVGSQSLLGIPRLESLRRRFAGRVAVWPFEAPDAPLVLAEVYPSLIAQAVAAEGDDIRDRAQVRLLSRALARMDAEGTLAAAFAAAEGPTVAEEGWILGVGAEEALRAAANPSPAPRPAATPTPPRLSNDCFALPPGVDWTPVDEALGRLRVALHPVVGTERLPLDAALGRVLAKSQVARRSNPPGANAAVDGYGFAHASVGEGAVTLSLAPGRAAAGASYGATVPPGHAMRILTGALLPGGVDTIVLEEDTSTDGAAIAFEARMKSGANTRRAGEDVVAGEEVLPKGRRLRPPDLALLAATGTAEIPVFRRLRIAVLSTGDELVSPGVTDDPARTYDANRPMLLSLARAWGAEPVDLGHAPDARDAVRAALNRGTALADLILTSGGASAGDEDHVSALLKAEGNLSSWRIALKPGRPLALAVWNGVPVMGLPGNPVAALVCALVFGRPAVGVLSGEGWRVPLAFNVPAAFEKRKKSGRREFLRARLDPEGRAEVFASEGSGRISGLAWAEGLVELPDGPAHIRPGDNVRYLPYAGFGL